MVRQCARCERKLSKPRVQARKKYCYRCELSARREQRERAHRVYVAKTYDIEPGDYDRLYNAQGRKCCICLRATGRTKRLAVDHDHRTGRVRGLICKPCNWLLGHARDDPEMFYRAAMYLIEPPAEKVIYDRTGDAEAVYCESA